MALKRWVFGIFLASLVLFSFPSSFAYTVEYEKWGRIIKETPTVCILEPDYTETAILTKSFSDRIMDESRISINEWMVQLQTSERGRDKSMWEIKQIPIPLEEQEDFDYDKCTVFIRFLEKPEEKSDWYKLLGKTSYEIGYSGRSDISIYYAAIELCKTEDKKWIYFDPCYKNYPRLMQQIQSVVKHEFGHSLGLGHYEADELDVNVAWARGDVPAPSIMAVFSHQNINKNFITPKDIDAVRTLYGENGFLPEKSKGSVFEFFEPSSFNYVLPKGGFIVADVNGLLSKNAYISGVPVKITISYPDKSIATREAWPNSNGVFNYQIIVNESLGLGDYTVQAEYRDVKSSIVSFVLISEGKTTQSEIPQWIKNSVRWWSQEKISDRDFILGIQYLIREGVLNPPKPDQRENIESSDGITKIPKFIKNTALWWTEGQIGDKEFVNALQYLIKKGILVI